MSTEAAERLLDDLATMLSEHATALAAERRATVERLRLEIRLSAFAANFPDKGQPYSPYREVLAILDAEAAK